MRPAVKLGVVDCIADCIRLVIPQAGYCPNLNYNFGVSAECLHKKPHRGDRTAVCDFLTLLMAACGACAACDGFGFARNTATTFDVFYWLQVPNFDVLLNSAPNGPDYIDIWGLCLHAQLFRSNDHKNSKKVQISQRDNPYQKSRRIQGTMRLLLVISDAA